MKLKPIIALLAFTVGALADDGDADDYGAYSPTYGSGYERERAEEPRAYISNGPVVVPVYPGEPAISSGIGSGSDFVGSSHSLRGSCFSAYGITSCY